MPAPSHGVRAVALSAGLALSVLVGTLVWGASPRDVGGGETLYRRGVLPSGQPVRATREAGATLLGSDAACSSCHRRSGLGSIEGKITIPPIAAAYLFAPRGQSLEHLGVPFVDAVRLNHVPYT